jgi:hypothetical protein
MQHWVSISFMDSYGECKQQKTENGIKKVQNTDSFCILSDAHYLKY